MKKDFLTYTTYSKLKEKLMRNPDFVKAYEGIGESEKQQTSVPRVPLQKSIKADTQRPDTLAEAII